MPNILIALGANLGDRGETLSQAIDELAADDDLQLEARSQLLVTKPVGGPAGQPDFLNAAARFSTQLSPSQVHQKLIEVECLHGRVRKQRWGARKLDLDLLLYDQMVIETEKLRVPHPRMSFRRFVIQPAAEVAPEMVHPELQVTLQELWLHLNQSPPIVEIAALPGPAVSQLAEAAGRELENLQVSIPADIFSACQSREELNDALSQAMMSPQSSDEKIQLLPWWHGWPSVTGLSGDKSDRMANSPRLVVYWNRPEETFGEVEKRWWTQPERVRLQKDLGEAVQAQVHGPRLWLEGNDLASAVTDLTAAIEASC
ncbi:2-amino-4-hydroxy-6-hydroxymethyldihydropteridine diphosphokinase [bacterium]|nr:2-amino-4-hydroxy-6-hydroxymethyldihydropteridine diphosphokinase [bacterium]